jgi:hypothetical protein
MVDCVWNVMAHAEKPDYVFRRNGRVHLNQQGRQFSRLLAAEVYVWAVVMLDTPCSDVVKSTGYPRHSPVSPSLPLPCVTVCHHVSTGLNNRARFYFIFILFRSFSIVARKVPASCPLFSLEGFPRNLILRNCVTNWRDIPNLVEMDQKYVTL